MSVVVPFWGGGEGEWSGLWSDGVYKTCSGLFTWLFIMSLPGQPRKLRVSHFTLESPSFLLYLTPAKMRIKI